MAEAFYKTRFGRSFTAGQGLPTISTDLDSVRTYQFEIHFFGLPDELQLQQTELTLAAKQVSPVGFSVEDIEVHRVNDKVFYPGKPTPEELTVTFDNLYLKESATTMWKWFKATYDPLTGEITKNSAPGGSANKTFKAHKVEIIQLDNTLEPHSAVGLYGVYPKSWKASEFNYSTNEFHTIEVTFRYDFLNQFNLNTEPLA
jgi:hypothetical protein